MEIGAYLKTIFLYILAGFAEIGGGWLVWQWLRNSKGILIGLIGGVALFIYGAIPTLQSEPVFGRVYAAYGGIFIVLSIIWGRIVDGWLPDRYDVMGAGIALVGVAVILWGRTWFH
jgi:small multidrug resistance family-3 protein